MLRYPVTVPPAPGEAIELAEGVLWMRLPLPMKLDHVNVYAFAETDGWTVIDTGFDSRRARAQWEALLDGPLEGRPVQRVIATHHHADHIGLAGWFQAKGASLWTSRTAWLMARMQVLDVQEHPTPEAVAFWRRAGMDAETLQTRLDERPFNMADVCHPLPPGFHRLAEGDALEMGGRRWRVHIGNGHAPEHLTLWSEDDHLVIGGDQLLPSISPNLGVYPTEPLADTVGDWLESCARLKDFARDDQLVLPGHNIPFFGLPERLDQLIENHHSALRRITRALQEAPRSVAGCFDILYRRKIDAATYGLALVEAIGHINHLARAGKVWPVGTTEDGAVLWGA
ncbi:MBL fold metallo-hydrolase [Paracoccus aminophilus]|uniref:Beta-lactamase domain-containing protein n=1 Tax=Paracoccus aminophilus JCM 7686 TaxID=1367847 RepID=S5XVG7_PARAH|nr:MBL fold metallo-hydrolase [Paracoccus aminophilus]AGT07370.1 beta-lactamase domain-containing protein [Paracoccus aminophilus JCM 7686]